LEALRIKGSVRETLVEAVLDQVRGRLQGLRLNAIYPTVLCRLAQTSLAELAGSLEEPGKTRLSADPRDETLLTGILHEMELNLPVSYDLECWGGLIARSDDNRVVVINTLEARLERAIPYLRRTLSAYFEDEQTDHKPEQVPEKVPMV
jgi:vacuolar-type H+-ATPase subunit E/Vma4